MRTLKPFDYFEPGSVREAAGMLSTYGEQARVLAGGIDLIPRMRKGKITAGYLLNIQKIPGLASMGSQSEKGLKFGAMTRLHSLECSKAVQDNYPTLYEAIHQISSVQIKYMGTAVGNICVATPASDVATALLALGAELTIQGVDGERKEPMEKFYLDYGRTSLQPGEIVTEVLLPSPTPGTGAAFMNLTRTCGDIAKVNTAVTITVKEGVCQEARIAVGAAAPTVFRATKAEAVLKGREVNPVVISDAAETAAGETDPITDLRSTAEYRKQMTRVLI
ncbi:MAG: xanthine dehydrogenase family protein subunit M, partial [Deltaproteobacteria bacterium]|nr:xanthine dehydrogenase family protein subunit M [Deltaproteobacteria bacterium]